MNLEILAILFMRVSAALTEIEMKITGPMYFVEDGWIFTLQVDYVVPYNKDVMFIIAGLDDKLPSIWIHVCHESYTRYIITQRVLCLGLISISASRELSVVRS